MEESKERVLLRAEVEKRVGLSRSPLYARIKRGEFPRPIRRGSSKAVGWLESEVDAWIERCREARDANTTAVA
jgi:prophage regulatory protein